MFARIFAALAAKGGAPARLMIDATHLKARHTAASLLQKGGSRRIGRTKGGLNSKLHVACDGQGRPSAFLRTEGQRSDHYGAALLLPILLRARELLGDRGCDSTWFRTARIERGVAPCIPSTRSRKLPRPYDRTLYRRRYRIEHAFGRLKDWRRVATRYDRCAHTFFSAICIAAIVIFWL